MPNLLSIQRRSGSILLTVFLLLMSCMCKVSYAQSDSSLQQQHVAFIELILQMLPPQQDKTQLMRDGQPIFMEIVGIADEAERTLAQQQLTQGFLKRDADILLKLFSKHALVPDFESSDNTTLVFVRDPDNTPEKRLLTAVKSQSLSDAIRILENESPDVNLANDEGLGVSFTPLMWAVWRPHIEMVNLLLQHGALPHVENKSVPMPAIAYAIMNNDHEITQALLDAGATVDFNVGLLQKHPPTYWAVRQQDLQYLKLLVENGADPSAKDGRGWTALSEALRIGENELAEYLIPLTDPGIETYPETRIKSNKFPDYRWFPASNALFLARQFSDDSNARLSEKILDRTEQLGGLEQRQLLDLKAWKSASQLAYAQGDTTQSVAHLEQGLSTIDISKLEPTSSGALVLTAMGMLADLHELRVVTERSFEDSYREQAAHITALGGGYQKWHDMLDAVELTLSENPTKRLESWQAKHGAPNSKEWNFDRLNAWVESQHDAKLRDRLYDTLDYFELN